MYAFLIVIHVIVSVVLILVILLQAGRGGGLSEAFGMSSTQTFFGTSATKFLQRATSVCAVVFLLTCLSLAAFSTHRSRSLMDKYKVKKTVDETAAAKEKPPAPPAAPKEVPKPAQ
jgi:preprotein translocase subunit SecG